MKNLMLILLTMTTVACAKPEEKPVDPVSREVREILLDRNPSFAQKIGFDLAFALAEEIHRGVRITGTPPWDRDIVSNMRRLFDDPDYGMVCGGIGISLADALRAFGIQARVVQMFSGGPDTHVATEAMIDGRWIAIDATFNAYFVDENERPLSFAEMMTGLRAGKALEPRYISAPRMPISAYYFPYAELMNSMKFLPPGFRSLPGWDNHVPGETTLVK